MKIGLELLPPMMPNFAKLKKQGITSGKDYTTVDIADFTKEEAAAYAELIKQTFLEHYQDRKKRLNKGL